VSALLLLLLSGQVADAGRLPSRDDAEKLVDQLIDQSLNGQVRRTWIRRSIREADPREGEAALARSAEDRIARRLAPGGDLYKRFVQSPEIYGSVEGPDYIRVVLEGNDWFTVLVDRKNGRPQVRSFELSSCGLCSEPERFVRDLLAETALLGDAAHRLLPGIEMLVSSVHPTNEWKRERWIWAYVNRAAGAEYTTRMLRNASVIGSRGRRVQVRLEEGEESWPVLYLRERWWLDYGALDPDSVWKMGDREAEEWARADTVRKARIAMWEPDWRSHAEGIEISDGALYIAPRTLQEDILIYDQDMGRRWAMWALLEKEQGRVQARVEAPRLPRRMFVDTLDWPALFRFALSPDGRLFAVSAHNRLWVFDLRSGETIWNQRDFSGAGGLAFSPDASALAVLDRSFGGLQIFSTSKFDRLSRAQGLREATDMVWISEGLLASNADSVAFIPNGAASAESSLDLHCSAGASSLATIPGKGETWVYCPAIRTRLLKMDHLRLDAFSSERFLQGERKAGGFAVDPLGQWMVIPAQRHQAEGMCLYDVEAGEERRCFGQMPLRQAHFDASGSTIYGIDQRGRAWKWRLSDLLD
jgi:hypothetical protein